MFLTRSATSLHGETWSEGGREREGERERKATAEHWGTLHHRWRTQLGTSRPDTRAGRGVHNLRPETLLLPETLKPPYRMRALVLCECLRAYMRARVCGSVLQENVRPIAQASQAPSRRCCSCTWREEEREGGSRGSN